MFALYFSIFPEEADKYDKEMFDVEQEEEEQFAEIEEALFLCVSKMKKSEFQEDLLQVLYDGSGWQFEEFIGRYISDYFN